MTPRIIDKQEKRQAIINAALGVFASRGYGDTRMEEVAKAVGIGKGTVYEYFDSKEALFFAIYEHVLGVFHEKIYSGIASQPSATAAISHLVAATLRAFEEWRDFSFVLLDFWSEHRRTGRVNLRFSEIYAFSRNQIASLVEQGIVSGEFRAVDPFWAASTIIAVLDGLLLQRVFDPETLSRPEAETAISSLLLKGLRR